MPAVREQIADVGDEGEVARGPESVGEVAAAAARPMKVNAAWAKVSFQRRE